MTESNDDRVVRLDGRNGDIWREYVTGRSQTYLAQKYGLSQQRISQIIRAVRDSIPEETRAEIVQKELDLWERIRAEILEEIYGAAPVPVTAGKDGFPVVDPETGAYVRDHSGRIAGATMALRISESIRRMVGVDAAQKVDVNLGEQAAAEQAAAEALARLAGLDGPDGPDATKEEQ